MGSLIPLLIKPGKLTVDYNNGKRARYLHPVRMFISIMIIFVIVNGLTSSSDHSESSSKDKHAKSAKDSLEIDDQPAVYFDTDSLPNFADSIKNEIAKEKAKRGNLEFSVGDGDKYGEAFELYESGVHSLDKILDSLMIEPTFWNRFKYSQVIKVSQFNAGGESRHAFIEYLKHKLPWIVFCMLPIFAFLLKLLYIRRKVLYVDQLIFAFHLHSFFFLSSTLMIILNTFISFDISALGLLYILIYTVLAMKKMYNQSWRKTVFKFFSLFFMYIIAGAISSSFVLIILFMMY